jgi:hypothetical protein
VGTGGRSPGGTSQPGRDTDHYRPFSAEVEKDLLSLPNATVACSGTALLLLPFGKLKTYESPGISQILAKLIQLHYILKPIDL